MYVVVIGNHGNAISPLASLPPSLLPLFHPLVASFPQAHLLPPHSLRPPRASRPPATFKYMAEAQMVRRFSQNISQETFAEHEIWDPFSKLHPIHPYQQKAI